MFEKFVTIAINIELSLMFGSAPYFTITKIFVLLNCIHICALTHTATHVSHLEKVGNDEINRLLGIVVDVENLFLCVHKEEDADTKQVYFYLFKVSCIWSSSKFTGIEVEGES